MLTDLDYELLSAYIDGALTDSQRTAFELRLQAEPELSRELDELRATITLLNNLPPRKAPRDFTLDARYTRRTSFFFTSATFSALSTAAAIILFALGTYLFTGNQSASSSMAPAPGQAAQLAFAASATADTLDKAAVPTGTLPLVLNDVIITGTPLNNPIPADGLTANDAVPQAAPTGQLGFGELSSEPPSVQLDLAQLTELPTSDALAGSAAVSSAPSDAQGRTSEATETVDNEQYAVPSTSNSAGAVMPASPMQETEANIAPLFAATQLPPTAGVASTALSMPTVTLAPTATNTPQSTATATVLPTVSPPPIITEQAPATTDILPLFLVGLGIILLLIAIVTTIIRRSNRR